MAKNKKTLKKKRNPSMFTYWCNMGAFWQSKRRARAELAVGHARGLGSARVCCLPAVTSWRKVKTRWRLLRLWLDFGITQDFWPRGRHVQRQKFIEREWMKVFFLILVWLKWFAPKTLMQGRKKKKLLPFIPWACGLACGLVQFHPQNYCLTSRLIGITVVSPQVRLIRFRKQ